MDKDTSPGSLTLIGRRSSLFTRLPLFHAEALGVTYGFVPVMNLTDLDLRSYGGHPALKLPVLQIGEEVVFGARNICRCIVARADAAAAARVHGLDRHHDALSMNAQELLSHAMSAQVQQVMGLQVAGLPADSLFFTKSMAGLQGALGWLDAHLEQVLATMPEDRLFSDFEVALFCLVEHFTFRATLDVSAWPSLQSFAKQFARHPAAVATAYRYDATPA
jgi:hypothetical protein